MPPTLTEAFPPLPLAELLDLIHRFDRQPVQIRKQLIERLVEHHVVLNLLWGRDWRYRRVRKLAAGEQVTNVNDVIWRQGQPATAGRVNPAGFGVLYLADRPDTAFTEARVQDDKIVISEFQILPGRTVRLYPVGELCQVQRSGSGFVLGPQSQAVSDLLNACQPWDVI